MTENEPKMTTVFHLQEYAQRSRNAGTRMHLLIFFYFLTANRIIMISHKLFCG